MVSNNPSCRPEMASAMAPDRAIKDRSHFEGAALFAQIINPRQPRQSPMIISIHSDSSFANRAKFRHWLSSKTPATRVDSLNGLGEEVLCLSVTAFPLFWESGQGSQAFVQMLTTRCRRDLAINQFNPIGLTGLMVLQDQKTQQL